jgi:ATP-dependent Clp protease ATP-binding subunit ClpA
MLFGELTEATAGMLAILSMLHWERKVGRAALERMGIDLDALARELDVMIDQEGSGARKPSGPQWTTLPSGQKAIVDTDTPLKPLLDQAEHEALGLGHNWVGTEHLLLAAVRSAGLQLQGILHGHAVSYEGVRQAVLELLQDRS